MSLRNLPEAQTFERPQNFQWDAPSDVIEQWVNMPVALDNSENSISIFDQIGDDVNVKRVAAALRSIDSDEVHVNINSPGGDMFEGIAIYNALRGHPGKVVINVMGVAASAASIIAMAGDEINMGTGSLMMIHNAWGMVIGNRHDMRDAAAIFDKFDGALAEIYEARTGLGRKKIEQMMDVETFMSANEAVKAGFADRIDSEMESAKAEIKEIDPALKARRQVEAALAKAGFSRDDRSSLLAEAASHVVAPRDASPNAVRDAGIDMAAVQQLIETIRS